MTAVCEGGDWPQATEEIEVSEGETIRVLLIDDHPVVRWGFRQIMASQATDIVVAADVATAAEALDALAKAAFDVVVLDINLDGRSGLELLERIRRDYPSSNVLIYTRYPEQDFALRAFRSGALGYIEKVQGPVELVRAVREVARGEPYVSSSAAKLLRAAVSDDRLVVPHQLLTRREDEVFRMLVRGSTVTEVAKHLNLSVKTVSTHRVNILAKLNAKGTADLVRYAIEHKLDA